MRLTISFCLSLFLVMGVLAQQGTDKKGKKPASKPANPKLIEGDWTLVSTTKGGKAMPAGGQTVYSLHNGSYTVKTGKKDVTESGTCKVHATAVPRRVEFISKDGRTKKALVVVNNGVQTLSFDTKDFPKSLESRPGSSHTVMKLDTVLGDPKMVLKALASAGPSGITVYLDNTDSYVGIGFSNPGAIGKYDMFGLYDHDPTNDSDPWIHCDPTATSYNYQWASNSQHYTTNVRADGRYWCVAYWGYDYQKGRYVLQALAWNNPS